MEYKNRFSLSVLASLVLCLPVLAQSQLSNNQPVCGELHARECNIQTKLKADYDAGRIDSPSLPLSSETSMELWSKRTTTSRVLTV